MTGVHHIRRWDGPQPWRIQAACRGRYETGWWHPEHGQGNLASEARRVCAGCPVWLECLVAGVRGDEPGGIWGGASDEERHPLGRALAGCGHDPLRVGGCGCRWCVRVAGHRAGLDRLVDRLGA